MPASRDVTGPIVVTDVPRPPLDRIDALAAFGVATVHEALGRVGLLGPGLRPIQQGVRIAGAAVTALCWPGDNLMVHAAVEQCRAGDVLVVTTTSPSSDGLFGELFGTALQQRGVRGLIITTGVRDTAELRGMGFPVWSAGVSAQGTVKATAGSVNVSVAIDRQLVRPGDVMLADDDGVICVPAARLEEAIARSAAREAKEEQARARYRDGELSLDVNGLRPVLERLGVRYARYDDVDV